MRYVPLEEIGIMRNLRTLGLSAVKNYGSVTKGMTTELRVRNNKIIQIHWLFQVSSQVWLPPWRS